MLFSALLILHVFCIIIWIGGVTFVTTVVFPMMYRTEGSLEKALLFQGVEHRFAFMVKWILGIVFVTGFWLLSLRLGVKVLAEPKGIGIVIMIFAWALYTTVLLSERKVFARIFADPSKVDMNKALKMINAMHWVLLTASYSAVAAGIWFGHAVAK